MGVVDVGSLPFSAKAAVTWSFFWRALLIGLGSSLTAGLAGFVIGFVCAVAGLPIEFIQIFGLLAGLIVGFFFFYLYIQWLLSTRLGTYRLQLVRDDVQSLTPPPPLVQPRR